MRPADLPASPSGALTRRQLLALGVGVFAVSAAPFLRGRRARLVRRAVPLMGTVAEIGVVHENPVYAHAAIDVAFSALRRVEALMTRFSPMSDVGRANRLAMHDAVWVAPATAAVLEAALAWASASDGSFDPCIGRAVELWDVEHRTVPPPAALVRRLAGRRLYRTLDLDRTAGHARVRFADRDVEIDLGGIAKGYGVDRAVAALREWGITRGIVDVGGDLYALGRTEDGEPWRVGIRSPTDPEGLVGTLDVADAAVATSGDYERFFLYHGRRYHHLLDPATAAPRLTPIHSVTIRAHSCLAADAGATAVYGWPEEAARRALRAGGGGAELLREL
jgi:thiamine biosynthesis lipoprotein